MDAAPRDRPLTYGEGDRPPRGDYADAADDGICDQQWGRYTAAEHDRFHRLLQRQRRLLPGLACDAFLAAVPHLGDGRRIPRFEALSQALERATGWRIAAVPGLIPERTFFALLAERRFPVTRWLRSEAELDYIVEPDVFHDLFGHVPLLFEPVFADYMQAFGAGGLKAERLGAGERLARLYWHTVEFGLIDTPRGVRAFGAGLLSSAGELRRSVRDPAPARIPFDLARLMRTRYRIDSFQPLYAVIDSVEQLFEATRPDFAPLYARLAGEADLEPGEVLPGERRFRAAEAPRKGAPLRTMAAHGTRTHTAPHET